MLSTFHTPPPPDVLLDVMEDLDGVNFWFDRGYHRAGTSLGYIDPARFPHQPASSWEFYERYEHDLDTFLKVCKEGADAGVLWPTDMIPGARPAWQDLAHNGHRIHVKTDRAFGSHPLVSQVATRMILDMNGLTYESLTFTADKTVGPSCDIALEDKLENYDALDAAGVQAWLIDRPWNQDNGSRRRVFTHDEFVARVRHLAVRKAKAKEAVS